jgi:hypothetical protein
METGVSLPCSQETATGPILSQMHQVHTNPSYFSKIHFNVILQSTCSLLTGLFPSGIPTTILYGFHFNPMRATCPVHLILLDLIILIIFDEEWKLWNMCI